jgi:hypothetical protein
MSKMEERKKEFRLRIDEDEKSTRYKRDHEENINQN